MYSLNKKAILWEKITTKPRKSDNFTIDNIIKDSKSYYNNQCQKAITSTILFGLSSFGRAFEKGVVIISPKIDVIDKENYLVHLYNESYYTLSNRNFPLGSDDVDSINKFTKAIIFIISDTKNNTHWSLLVYYPHLKKYRKTFYHYDSLGNYNLNIANNFLNKLIEFGLVHQSCNIVNLSNNNFPKQKDGTSCGWYTICFGLRIIDTIQNSVRPVKSINNNNFKPQDVIDTSKKINIFATQLRKLMLSGNTKVPDIDFNINIKEDCYQLYNMLYILNNPSYRDKFQIYNYLLELFKFKFARNSGFELKLKENKDRIGGLELIVNDETYFIENTNLNDQLKSEFWNVQDKSFKVNTNNSTTSSSSFSNDNNNNNNIILPKLNIQDDDDELVISKPKPMELTKYFKNSEQLLELVSLTSAILKSFRILTDQVLYQNNSEELKIFNFNTISIKNVVYITSYIHNYLASTILIDMTYAKLFNCVIDKTNNQLYNFLISNNNNNISTNDIDYGINETFTNLPLFKNKINQKNDVFLSILEVFSKGGKIILSNNNYVLNYNDIVVLSSYGINILSKFKPKLGITIKNITMDNLKICIVETDWNKFVPFNDGIKNKKRFKKKFKYYLPQKKNAKFITQKVPHKIQTANVLTFLKPKSVWEFKFEFIIKNDKFKNIDQTMVEEFLIAGINDNQKLLKIMEEYPFLFLTGDDKYSKLTNVQHFFNDINLLQYAIEEMLKLLKSYIKIDINLLRNSNSNNDLVQYRIILMKLIQIYTIHFNSLPPMMHVFPIIFKYSQQSQITEYTFGLNKFWDAHNISFSSIALFNKYVNNNNNNASSSSSNASNNSNSDKNNTNMVDIIKLIKNSKINYDSRVIELPSYDNSNFYNIIFYTFIFETFVSQNIFSKKQFLKNIEIIEKDDDLDKNELWSDFQNISSFRF